MKTLAIHLRLETASHRKRMMGIFREIGASSQYDIRIISNEDILCDLLTAANGAERPDAIISGVPYSERTKKTIGTAGVPLVGIGMSENEIIAQPKTTGFVLNDNEGIGRTAADFFLSLGGFRSFAYIPDMRGRSWSILRGKAFSAALSAAGGKSVTYRSVRTKFWGQSPSPQIRETTSHLLAPAAIASKTRTADALRPSAVHVGNDELSRRFGPPAQAGAVRILSPAPASRRRVTFRFASPMPPPAEPSPAAPRGTHDSA